MSDKPNIPSMGAGKPSPRNLSRNEAVKRVSELEKELESVDERAAGQEMREQELRDREQEIQMREQALANMARAADRENPAPSPSEGYPGQRTPNQLPPRVSTDEDKLRENTHAAINSRSIHGPLETGKKFPDITPYLQKYGDEFQLMWINDVDGDVQRWIDHGAEPVEWLTNRNRTFAGITDSHESQWVRIVGGETRSGVFYVYLLKISYAEYARIKISPVKARQELIRRSMIGGGDQSTGGKDALGGPNLPTYAAELPSGSRGLEQLRDVAGEIPGL